MGVADLRAGGGSRPVGDMPRHWLSDLEIVLVLGMMVILVLTLCSWCCCGSKFDTLDEDWSDIQRSGHM